MLNFSYYSISLSAESQFTFKTPYQFETGPGFFISASLNPL